MGSAQHSLNGRIIEAVTLDFWGTLADTSRMTERRDHRRDRITSWLLERGIETDADFIGGQMQELALWWNEIWTRQQRTPSSLEAAARLLQAVDAPDEEPARGELAEVIEQAGLDLPPEPIEGAIEAVRRLADEFRLALVCDTGWTGGKTIDRILDSWGLLELIPVRSYSDSTGSAKPHPRAFLAAVEGLGIPQQRVVHIGDLEATDIRGAKSIGMAAVRFQGALDEKACRSCSIGDGRVQSWPELIALLLDSESEPESLPSGLKLG